jgi:hypothetical protein
MTSPSQLVRTLSETTGVSLPTVIDIDRRLLKAGLRTKGGRGLYAARVTALDVARLLTVVLASAQANLAAGAVDRYTQTQVDRARSSEKLFAASGLADLAALPIRHSFIEGLANLISSTAHGALARIIKKNKNRAPPIMEIFAFTQATYGRIRLAGLPNGITVNIEYLPTSGEKGARAKKENRGIAGVNEPAGDLEQSRRVTERTILAVAQLLAEESEHGCGFRRFRPCIPI